MRPTTKHAVPPAGDICRLSAVELADRIRRRQLSVREVVSAFLDRIEAVNPRVNAIVSLRDPAAILAEADSADAHLSRGGEAGSLFGLPIAIKDLALTKGLRTTFDSPIFADFVPGEDDFFVERVRKAGAIIIGKTNVPEFGFGSQTYNEVFGATRNAFDQRLTSGGSSGGAAVAVALNMLPVADGSDMCGSLRNPAGWNNVFGFRTSPGRVPIGPANELFLSQMGVKGPMARSVADLALLLGVQAGYDPRRRCLNDGFRLRQTAPADAARRVGATSAGTCQSRSVLDLVRGGARARKPATSGRACVPDCDFAALWQAFVTLRHATSGAALKIHYDDPDQRDLLKPETVWEIEGALGLMAPKIHDASIVRSRWYKAVLTLFERNDLLALPSAQVFAFDAEIHWPSEIAGRKMDSYHRWMEVTALATMAGCPVANVPVGFDKAGRAMGMQLIGRPRADAEVLSAAADYEQALGVVAGA